MTELSADVARTLELLRDADEPPSYEELAARAGCAGRRTPSTSSNSSGNGSIKRMDAHDSATP